MKSHLFFLLSLSVLVFGDYEEIDVSQHLRIEQLMPRDDLLASLAIEPAIPDDFISLGALGKIDYSNWVFWGPKQTIEDFLKDTSSLSSPIISVKLSEVPISKDGLFEEATIRSLFPPETGFVIDSLKLGNWGIYPYCALECSAFSKKLNVIYVNIPDSSGIALQFHLISPQTENGQKLGKEMWSHFLEKTTMLSPPLFFKALGQEMHLGYTVVDILNHKIKVLAERRKKDRIIQFIAIPYDHSTMFNPNKAFTCAMGSSWYYGAPLLKIEGTYILDKESFHSFQITSVFLQEVDEFTNTTNLPGNAVIRTCIAPEKPDQ